MNNPQQQQIESGVFIPEGSEINSKYQSMLDYETYPSRYQNLNINPTNGAGVSQLRVASQCSFRSDKNSCTIIGSQAQIASATEPDILELEKHSMLPTVRYLQPSQYDEMSEYGNIATSSCNLEPNYVENTAVTYGYVSEANYGVLSETINTNSFSTRALHFDNNLNGSKSVAGMEQKCQPFDSHAEYQSKMSQLTLNPVDVLREIKDDFMDENSTDLCSAMRWRDPNLSEVISFLNNPNNAIKSNAAAYLQHLCYMDDPNKQRTRLLGGIPPLIHLLAYDVSDIQKNACGALRNLSYGRQNDENKRAIKNAGGVSALVNLLCRTQESEVKELVTGILWNMSSCEDIKKSIIDDSLMAIVINVIIPHSGWDPVCPGETCFSTVFRNASGILRNVSSAGEYARKSLRESQHLVDSLLYVVRKAIEKNNIGNKTVENCVCILRNLSYRCQEVEDPNYDKQYMAPPVKTIASPKGENLGCFGTGRKKEKSSHGEFVDQQKSSQTSTKTATPSSNSVKGYEQLWHPEVIQCYLSLLQSCSNPETLEASAGAIQNLSACYWQPSIDIRATVRKEKGLPILVELLRMEVDRVVCAVATALRNLAIDQRNKELIGKYAMRDLVQKLPSGNAQHDQTTSDDTISAVLATINEVVKKNPEFARSVLDAGGIERLMNITRQKTKYTTCVLKFASQVLYTMWQHNELRDAYKKNGWKEHDFVTKYVLAQNASVNSPNNPNSTLNRPMASQSRTKYEDRTIQRTSKNTPLSNGSLGLPSFKESSSCQKDTEEPGRNGIADDSFERKNHISTVSMFIASDGTD